MFYKHHILWSNIYKLVTNPQYWMSIQWELILESTSHIVFHILLYAKITELIVCKNVKLADTCSRSHQPSWWGLVLAETHPAQWLTLHVFSCCALMLCMHVVPPCCACMLCPHVGTLCLHGGKLCLHTMPVKFYTNHTPLPTLYILWVINIPHTNTIHLLS